MTADEFVLYDAAYVLGALSPTERRDFESHLEVCAACARSVSELAGLPGLMSKVSVDLLTAQAETPPDTLLPALARAVGRERRRRLLILATAAAVAACLIVAGTVAAIRTTAPARPVVAASSQTGTSDLAMASVVPSPVTATSRLVDMAWGTRIDLTCHYRSTQGYPASGAVYALVVVNRSGAGQQVATWTAVPNRDITVMGATSRARADIAAVEIRTAQGQTILRLRT
ncbi:zf-HC2 domain-containing protein [Dermatophilaceae bacterium Soc4.6]